MYQIFQFLAKFDRGQFNVFSGVGKSGVVRREKFSGGFNVMAGLVGGLGGWAPRTPENVWKFAKNSLTNCKNAAFSPILQKVSKPCVEFSLVWTKNTIGWGNCEKILKFFDENSIEKLNFYLFLGKFVAKNRAFGNNIIFLPHFLPARGFERPNLTCLRHCMCLQINGELTNREHLGCEHLVRRTSILQPKLIIFSSLVSKLSH